MAKITDNFNRSDAGSLGTASGGFTWTSNGMSIVSNTGFGSFANWEEAQQDLDSVDHYAQATQAGTSSSNSFNTGLGVRRADSQNFYWYKSTISAVSLNKTVANSNTELAVNTSVSIGTGDVMKLVISSDDLELFENGVSILSTSDSSLTTGKRTSMLCGWTAGSFDDFEAADLGGGAFRVMFRGS